MIFQSYFSPINFYEQRLWSFFNTLQGATISSLTFTSVWEAAYVWYYPNIWKSKGTLQWRGSNLLTYSFTCSSQDQTYNLNSARLRLNCDHIWLQAKKQRQHFTRQIRIHISILAIRRIHVSGCRFTFITAKQRL